MLPTSRRRSPNPSGVGCSEQRHGGHDLAGLAITALNHLAVEPGVLNLVADCRAADSLDRRDLDAPMAVDGSDTGARGHAIDMHVQAPQSAIPQPNFVPVMPARRATPRRSGVSPSTSTLCVFPLILMTKAMATSPFAPAPVSKKANRGANRLCDSDLRTACASPAGPNRQSAFGGYVDDSLSEGLWGFLWKIVADAARDIAVRIFAREFRRVGAGIRMRRPVRVTFKRSG